MPGLGLALFLVLNHLNLMRVAENAFLSKFYTQIKAYIIMYKVKTANTQNSFLILLPKNNRNANYLILSGCLIST